MWSATSRWNTVSGSRKSSEGMRPAAEGPNAQARRPARRAGLIKSQAARRVLLALVLTGIVLVINQLDGIIETGRWLVLAWAAPLTFVVALGLTITAWRDGRRRERGRPPSTRGYADGKHGASAHRLTGIEGTWK